MLERRHLACSLIRAYGAIRAEGLCLSGWSILKQEAVPQPDGGVASYL